MKTIDLISFVTLPPSSTEDYGEEPTGDEWTYDYDHKEGFTSRLVVRGSIELPAAAPIDYTRRLGQMPVVSEDGTQSGIFASNLVQISLVDYLTVEGTVNLSGQPISEIPAYWSVSSLNLEGCKFLSKLHETLEVKNFLNLAGTAVEDLVLTHYPELILLPSGQTVPGKIFECGATYRGGVVDVSGVDPAGLKNHFITTLNAEVKRTMRETLGDKLFFSTLDLIVERQTIFNGQQVRILRSRLQDNLIENFHYYVEVTCTSTGRKYLLGVPPERADDPVDAIAYTFGMSVEAYAPLIET